MQRGFDDRTVHLRHEGHEDDEWEGYFSLETASRESIELLDLGFFDGEEMALLLRYQKTGAFTPC